MRSILSISCILILPTIVEAASCGLLMAGTVSCTDKTKTATAQTDSIIAPEAKLTRPSDATLRKTLTPEQHAVTQQAAAERPFANEYSHEFREGIYVDIITGESLFSPTDKFDPGCGWLTFSKPIDKEVITNHTDTSHGMVRMEVRSKTGRVHLGHVLDDGPVVTGDKGYCINNASLRSIPLEGMRAKSYGAYIELVRPMEETYVAGGCSWGTEHYSKQIEGVAATEVGYTNGIIKDPTYGEVCTGKIQFAEAVHITYGPKIISLDSLLGLYFKPVDPTNTNKQGNDCSSQHRTGVYHTDPADLLAIKKVLGEEQEQIHGKIAVEVRSLKNSYTAEECHQDYLDKHSTNYCHLPAAFFEYARKAKMER